MLQNSVLLGNVENYLREQKNTPQFLFFKNNRKPSQEKGVHCLHNCSSFIKQNSEMNLIAVRNPTNKKQQHTNTFIRTHKLTRFLLSIEWRLRVSWKKRKERNSKEEEKEKKSAAQNRGMCFTTKNLSK